MARKFPNAIIHWEDFAIDNARRILMRYRSQYRTFNDDMQGTGAIVLAAALSAAHAAGVPLHEQRVVLFGAGTAGIGIAEQLRDAMLAEGLTRTEAQSRFWCLGRKGLLVESLDGALRDFQRPWARPDRDVLSFARNGSEGGISFDEVVRQVQPTMLIGTSTVAGSFTPVQSHRALRGGAGRSIGLDGRPRVGRNWEPVPSGPLRRHHLCHCPGQQCPGLSRAGPGGDRLTRRSHQRRDARRRSPHRGRIR